jgi:hypothetical protein
MSLALIDTRRFSAPQVLCVATHTIPDASLMPEVYRILEYMTGGPVSTERLAQAMYEAHRFLVHRCPHLALGWEDRPESDESGRAWFAQKAAEAREGLVVPRI